MNPKTKQVPFIQDAPHLGNQFLEDSALLDYMKFLLPQDVINSSKSDLINLGHRVIAEVQAYANDAERNQPTHEPYDAWGNRIDKIHTTLGWKELKRVAAEEGIVGFGYENHYGEYRRLLQMIRLYLYAPSSGLFNCPLAMTDGAAFLLRNILIKDGASLDPQVKKKIQKAYNHLISRDPKQFWTSGQWMTERRGGSDVSRATETIAEQDKGSKYKLYGDKWFTSAAESEMCVTLARVVDPNANADKKGRAPPLSLFFVKMRNKQGKLNGIEIRRLKEKLGTKQLPTAELELHGSKATLISPEGKGVKYISDMLNITRLYNAVAGVSAMRRMIALARDWAGRRKAWGTTISELPLQKETLKQMEIRFRGSLMFTLTLANILGKMEEGKATQDEGNIFRIMIPILKLFVGKEAVAVCSEGVECFGGQGYIETTGIPGILRDVQVTTIWEGTTNVLCHDFVRALNLGNIERLESFAHFFRDRIGKIMQSDSNLTATNKEFREAGINLIESFNELYSDLHEFVSNPKALRNYECNLREICFALARIFIAIQLGLCCLKSGNTKDTYIFIQWLGLAPNYKRYHSAKGKFQTSTELLNAVGLDQDDKTRHDDLKKDVAPHLLIRPKF